MSQQGGVIDSHVDVQAYNNYNKLSPYHEDESQWRHKGRGQAGWMVRCDELGVYHGHADGITMNARHTGRGSSLAQLHADVPGRPRKDDDRQDDEAQGAARHEDGQAIATTAAGARPLVTGARN